MYATIHTIFKDENPTSIFEVGCAQGKLFKEYYDDRTRLSSSSDTDFDRTRLKVGGIDIDPRNIPGAKENYPDYADNFFIGDARKSPWPVKDKEYDIVFTVGTLLLFHDPFPTIKEMLRIGKKVILGEYQESDQDAYGLNRGVEPEEAHGLRMYRDYQKVFDALGVKIEILDGESGKTIIKTCPQ